MYDVDELTENMPEGAAILIRRIILTDGTEIKNAIVEERAPRIQGFIALATRRKTAKSNSYIVEATRYISLNSIAAFTIDNEVLQRVSPSYFIPEQEIKIKR